ncbi:MAG: hypothetical protein QXS19_09150 [Candidatus Methanomethylicia archaeon]
MLPIIKTESKLSLLAKDKVKDIKVKEQSITIDDEQKRQINEAFMEGLRKIGKSVYKFLKYDAKNKKYEVDLAVISTDGDPVEFSVNRYSDSLSHVALNIIPEDIPVEISDTVTSKPDALSDIVVSYPVRNSAKLDSKNVLNAYYSRSILSGFINVSDNYNPNVSDFYHAGDVKKACMVFDKIEEFYLIPSDTVKIEFGINNDFRHASSKHKYLGDFNGAGRLDRGNHYRTDQNAWKDVVFSYYGIDKTNTILSMPLPFNLDIENMLSKYSALSMLYKNVSELSDYILTTPLDVSTIISINYALNINSYFFSNMYDMNTSASGDDKIGRFVKISNSVYSKRKGVEKNFDPVINDAGFMYFEADNPLWRGTIYWPGCFVRNVAVYGSPYHLEIGNTRTGFAAARYITHNYIKAFGTILENINIPVMGYDLMFKNKDTFSDIFHIKERESEYTYEGINMGRNISSSLVGKINKMLLYAISINSMTKQCVKEGKAYYASHYLRDKYFTEDLIKMIDKHNNMLSLCFGLNYKIQETDYSREINHMYSPHAAALLDLAVHKYWETVEENERLLQEGHPVFNA